MISVIIPLYNKEQIVERSVRSVLSQDYDDFEVVIVDDGSTDRSKEVVRGIDDARIRIVEQENGGPSKARNTGVRYAKGEWVVFLDADDELLPGALSYFLGMQERHSEADFFCAPYVWFEKGVGKICFSYDNRVVRNPYREHFGENFLPRTGAFLCRREKCLSVPFNERLWRFEDLEWQFRIYRQVVIFTCSQPVLRLNVGFASASCARKDIEEDFIGHLDFRGKCFWERMSLYAFYLGERDYYGEQTKRLYPTLRYRYDLLVIYKMLKALTSLLKRI